MSATDHDEEPGGHERWIISYADLVTLLFAFFTVMYSISVVNVSKYRVVSESVSTAINGKERTRTFPVLNQEAIAPNNPQRDFLNETAFTSQPGKGDMSDRDLLQGRIMLLSQQQRALAIQIEPGGDLFNLITNQGGVIKLDTKPALDKLTKQLLGVQQNILDTQKLLKVIFDTEDADKTRLVTELADTKIGLTGAQTTISNFKKNLQEISLETANIKNNLQELSSENARVKNKLQELFSENAKLINFVQSSAQQVEEFRSVKIAVLNGYQERSDILNQLQKIMSQDGVIVEIDLKNGILRLPESLLFGPARADFSPSGIKAIATLSKNLLKVLPCYGPRGDRPNDYSVCADSATNFHLESVLIEGHTDILPIATDQFKDNWDLSFRRAKNTFLEVIKSQPKIEILSNANQQPLLSFSSYAERRPIVTNETEAGRRQNRRIDLRFIMTPVQIRPDRELSELNTGLNP